MQRREQNLKAWQLEARINTAGCLKRYIELLYWYVTSRTDRTERRMGRPESHDQRTSALGRASASSWCRALAS